MFGMYDPRPEQRLREAELRAEQNGGWLDELKARHPVNIKCKVECFDPDDNLPFCWCSRMQERGDMDIPSKPLSELKPRELPSDRFTALLKRIGLVAWRVLVAFLLALLIAGRHNGAPFIVVCWLILAVWLEIVSFRFAVTRK